MELVETERRRRLQREEVDALFDNLPTGPEVGVAEVKRAIETLSQVPDWDVIRALLKIHDAIGRKNKDLTKDQLYDRLAEELTDRVNATESREQFIRSALEGYEGEIGKALRGGAEEVQPSATGRELRALDRPPIPLSATPTVPSTGKVPYPFEPGGPRETGTLAKGRGTLPRLAEAPRYRLGEIPKGELPTFRREAFPAVTKEPAPVKRKPYRLPGEQGYVKVGMKETGPLVRSAIPPAAEGTARPLAFNKRAKERAFWAARGLTDPVGAFNRWYGQWLSEAVRSNGGERANEAATIADAIVDRAKKLYGEQTDILNPAKEQAGGSARLPVIGEVPSPAAIKRNVWLQKLSHPVSKDTGIANVQEAVEGRLPAPPELQPTIDAIGLANLQAGRLVQPVTPGFRPSNKWQRNMTPFGFDMLAEGPSHPNWKTFTRDTALDRVNYRTLQGANLGINTRGDAIRFTRQFFREWGEALNSGGISPKDAKWAVTTATNQRRVFDTEAQANAFAASNPGSVIEFDAGGINRVERINQDFKRLFPRAVTHVRTPIGYQEVIHANPVNYLELVAQRAAFTRAFREQFPNNPSGQKAFSELDYAVRAELPPNIIPYWDALVKTMQSRPADRYTSLGPIRPGAPLGEFIKGFNATALATLKRLALTAQVGMGGPETLGTGVAELGMRNKLAGAAKLKQLWHEFEKRGQVNAMIYDWSFDPSSPIRSLFRQSNNILAKGFAENLHNELQGRWNAATASAAADRVRNQQAEPLTAWEKRQYPETFRKMQFTKEQVAAMMQGDEPLLQAFERRFPSWMSGENAPMSERSMAAQKRWFNSVFAFQPYPMTIANQFTRNLSRLGEAYRTGTKAEKIAATEGMARFIFAKGAMGLGYLALGSLISGGLPGAAVKGNEAKDEPMQFMLEALLASLSGPYYLFWQAIRRGGGLSGAGKTVTSTMFPFSQVLDVVDAVEGNGQYRDQDLQARVGRYFLQKVPAARAIRQGLAAAGLADANPQLEAAISGAARWKRDELGWDQTKSFREEDNRKQFRTKMRAAVQALQKNDLDTYLERLAEAVNEAAELGGKTKPTARVASSLRGRKILRSPDDADLTPEQLDALAKRIGENAVERLRYYDATLEGMAKSLE